MRPVAVVGGLVEANTVRAGRGANTARFFVSIELEVADEATRVVIEVREVLSRRLLEGDLLRRSSQYRWKGRGCSPDVLQARVVLLFTLQARDTIGQLRLILLYPKHLALEAPEVLAGLKGYALWIHSRSALIPWWECPMKRPLPSPRTLPFQRNRRATTPPASRLYVVA